MYNQNRQVFKSINMTELMTSVSGPWFLLFYAVISVLLIFLFKKIAENDATRHLEIPDPATVAPFDIALLANGTKRALLVAVFNLWQQKKLIVTVKKNDIYIKTNPGEIKPDAVNKAEGLILELALQERSYKSFFRKKSLSRIMETTRDRLNTLKSLQLYAGNDTIRRYWILSAVCSLLLVLVGGFKIYVAFSLRQDVLLPALLMLASVAAVFYFIKPSQVALTALGRNFLKASAAKFGWLKKENNPTLPAGNNLLYAIALYGAAPYIKGMPAWIDAPLKTGTYNDSYSGETTGDTTL